MRVAVIGSRECEGLTVEKVLANIPKECTEIVSGGARGVDQLARQAAKALGLLYTEYLPDYNVFGKKAPLVRNTSIIAHADYVLAFWDYHSNGTRDALLKGLRQDKPIKIVLLREPFDDIRTVGSPYGQEEEAGS